MSCEDQELLKTKTDLKESLLDKHSPADQKHDSK